MDLLPADLKPDAVELYLALRTLDDLVDERAPLAAERVEAARRWAETREVSSPETTVFERLAVSRSLRPSTVGEFCLAMQHDIASDHLETDSSLEEYCGQVAGAVGKMFAEVVGVDDEMTLSRAQTLGKAIQLAHVLRDIDVDLADGRTYVPQESIERFGSILPGEREELLRYWIGVADAWFEEGESGIPQLPIGRSWVAASSALYKETLRTIEREGYGATSGSVVVDPARCEAVIAEAVAAFP